MNAVTSLELLISEKKFGGDGTSMFEVHQGCWEVSTEWLAGAVGRAEVELELIEETAGTFGKV